MIALLNFENKPSESLLSKNSSEFQTALINTTTQDIEALAEALASINKKLGRALTRDERKSRIQKMEARLQVLRYTDEFIPYQDNHRGFQASFEMSTKGIVIEITSPEGESWVESTSIFKNTEANRHFRLSVNSRLPKPEASNLSIVENVPQPEISENERRWQMLNSLDIGCCVTHSKNGLPGIYKGVQDLPMPAAWVQFDSRVVEPVNPLELTKAETGPTEITEINEITDGASTETTKSDDRWRFGWEPGTIIVPSAVGNDNEQFSLFCSGHEIKVKTVSGVVGEIQLLFLVRSDGETFSVYGNWVEECPIIPDSPSNPSSNSNLEILCGDKVRLLSTVKFSDIDPNTKLMPNAVLGFEGEIAEVCGVSDNKLALSIGGGETFDYFKSGVAKVDDFDDQILTPDNQTVTDDGHTLIPETAEIFTTLDCYDQDWGDEPLDPDDIWSVGDRVQHKKSLTYGLVQGLERSPMLGGYLNLIIVLWDGSSQVEAVEPETLWRVSRAIDEYSDKKASDSSNLKDSPVTLDESGQSLVLISSIRRDGGTQPRVELNQATIEEYTADRLKSVTLPPIIVFYDGTDYWLGDGYHRVAAEEAIKNLSIRAEIRVGTRRDAVLFSCSANATHGLRRTNADKRRAVETLLSDDEWGKWSNREIAKRAGVDEKTVRNIRDSQGAENPHPAREVPRGKGNASTSTTSHPESEDFLVESEAISSATSHPHVNEVEINGTNHAAIPKPITSVAEELKEWGESLGIPPSGLPEMPRNEGIEPENYYEKAALLESAIDQVVADSLRLTVSQTNRLMGALAQVCPSAILGHIQLEKLSEFELDSLIAGAQAARSRFDQELLAS